MTYDLGDLIELTATFTDPDTGAAVEPTKVVCTVLSPAGITSTPVVSGEKGVYTAQVEPTLRGKHHYAFDGTGSNQASAEGVFHVRAQEVAR